MIAGRSTTGGGTITSFHSHIKDVGYDGVYSLPRHRAAQSMETGRDPAAMVVKAQKRPPGRSGPPARISLAAPENITSRCLGFFSIRLGS